MDFFKMITSPLTWLIKVIDNGLFFKRPMSWFYIINGIVAALIPIIVIALIFNYASEITRYANGWEKFVVVIMQILAVVGLLLLSIYGFMFWKDRSKQLGQQVRRGDTIVAIPTFGHYLQTVGECLGVQIILIGTFVSALVLVFSLLAFSEYLNFGRGLVIFIVGVFVSCLIGYLLILGAHVVGETYRIKAIVGNNVRDMGDIMRATTMIEKEAE